MQSRTTTLLVRAIGAFGIFTLVTIAADRSVAADSAASFYKGRQVSMIIPYSPGGAYDILARLLARHMGKHLTGNPSFISLNMPGGGGMKAANYLANVAPRDGSVMAIVSQGLPLYQLRDGKGLKADMRTFNWLGNMSYSNQMMAAYHTAPVKTLEDAKKTQLIIAASGKGAIPMQLAAAYNYLVGTKLKIIYGYRGSSQMYLAMERGEVEGRATNTWAGYRSEKPQWIADKKLNFLIQVGLEKEADLPHVPLLQDLVKGDPDKEQIARALAMATKVGRPIAAPPGVPDDRVAALRKAFDETLLDPGFKADAKRSRAEIRSMTGAELTDLINDIFAIPKSLVSKLNYAISARTGEVDKRKAAKK
ncbi:MAG: tripartite tricarboxylate transporter substrate-binding protein [Proteobacteria bacterium]|nr:tripartite tricarboxylate transporter substrate-binding protein [Pseudomonadota bacterium]MDA1324409.1 tripartite tricarboxylate transporter substrate-binding protein [Pseudomonadota bacterium]